MSSKKGNLIFERMQTGEQKRVGVESKHIASVYLKRDVTVDIYLPLVKPGQSMPLLLINDGQDLVKMKFDELLDALYSGDEIRPLLCAAIHCGSDRKLEYGTAACLDYLKRGSRAKAYNQFLLDELLPVLKESYPVDPHEKFGIAGFSLGGLSAMDTAWNHPNLFSVAGVFSGSLWWRSKDLKKGYQEDRDRIMHRQVREGTYYPGLRFYFTTGSLDETADRNNNGIIDSIDDTQGLIAELEKLGYKNEADIRYINYEDGRHDVETWCRAMPDFLRWGWPKRKPAEGICY